VSDIVKSKIRQLYSFLKEAKSVRKSIETELDILSRNGRILLSGDVIRLL